MKKPNFLEYETVEGANQVDLNIYSFVRFSEKRQCYIFKKRVLALKIYERPGK